MSLVATRIWLIVALLTGCGPSAPEMRALPPPLATLEPVEPAVPALPPRAEATIDAAPAALRAELATAEPRALAAVASSSAKAPGVAKLRTLRDGAYAAMAELTRDGGRHVGHASVARAREAVGEYLDALPATAAAPEH